MAETPSVKPIAGSNVAWTTFLKDTVSITGRSPVRGMDASGLQLSDFAKYLSALGELRNQDAIHPNETLRSAGSLLRHLHFSFIITGPPELICKITELTKLDVVSASTKTADRYALFSGTLEVWKAAVSELSRQDADAGYVAQTLLGFFSHIGLKAVFNDLPRLTGNL